MQLNLHELINQPGYGKANEAVRKAGLWDDMRAHSAECKPFDIAIEGSAYITGTVQVWAESLDEALEKASYIYKMHDGMRIARLTIEEVEEAKE